MGPPKTTLVHVYRNFGGNICQKKVKQQFKYPSEHEAILNFKTFIEEP